MMQQTGDVPFTHVGPHFTQSTFRAHYILKKLDDGFLADQKVDFLYDHMKVCSFPFKTDHSVDMLMRFKTIYSLTHLVCADLQISTYLHLSDGSSSPEDLCQPTWAILGW